MTPNFDEIVGSDLSGAERERLRHVHELLVVAGRPPELTPELQQAPNVQSNLRVLGRRRPITSRAALLLAAAIAVGLVFVGGYAVGQGHTGGSKPVLSVALQGTPAAPQAQGQLAVFRPSSGDWPMKLTVVGLPKLAAHRYYEVYLVRHGKPWGSCGKFRITTTSGPVTVPLTAPYALRSGDSWVVTRERPSEHGAGQKVLTPALRA